MCQLLRAAVHTAACAGVHVGRSQDAFFAMLMWLECRAVWHTRTMTQSASVDGCRHVLDFLAQLLPSLYIAFLVGLWC